MTARSPVVFVGASLVAVVAMFFATTWDAPPASDVGPLRATAAANGGETSDAVGRVARAESVAAVQPTAVPDSGTPEATAPDGAVAPVASSGPDGGDPVPPAAAPESITLAFAGDLLPHSPLNRAAAAMGTRIGTAYDYAPMLAPMRQILEPADLAICHMEVPLHPEGQAPSSYPSFGAPPELVAGILSAGYDGCSTASNHSLDRGRAGLGRLLDTMDAAGLGHNGTARNADEGDGRATFYDVGGVTVAHLSWAYGFNGYRIPDDAPWSVNQIDPERIAARAADARLAGADLVVVSLHWGAEYRNDPTPQQELWAESLTASPDIDLIVGHHAHVVQPISKVNGTFVVWGLGNQLSNQTQMPRRDGLTVRVHAGRGPDGRWMVVAVDAIPTFVELSGFRVLPVVETLAAGGVAETLARQLRESYARTAAVLARRPTDAVRLAPLP